MATLTRSGRIALAISVKDRPIHLAWGSGAAWWDTYQTVTGTFPGNNTINLGRAPVSEVVVKNVAGNVTYVLGTDYTVNTNTGIVTRVGGGAITGDVAITFFAPRPAESIEKSVLENELGRRKATEVSFCNPDNAGAIIVPTGRFAYSATPTNNLYMRFVYDFEDAAGSTIREQAIYIDTATQANLPAGQMYFTPAQVSGQGTLLVLQHSPAIVRQASTRETFEFVVTL